MERKVFPKCFHIKLIIKKNGSYVTASLGARRPESNTQNVNKQISTTNHAQWHKKLKQPVRVIFDFN